MVVVMVVAVVVVVVVMVVVVVVVVAVVVVAVVGMQNLALLLDVSSRKTRQHMKPLEAWVRAFPIHLPGLTPTQELKERAYAEVGGEEPRTKKTQDQTMYRYSCTGFPEKEKQTREDCSNTLFSWQAGSVAQNSKDVQVLKDLLQGSHSLDWWWWQW